MKNLFTFLLALIIGFPALTAQIELDPDDLTTDLFLPTVKASQHYYDFYADDVRCSSGLSWLQNQANVYQLKTEKSEIITNKHLFSKVMKSVRESDEGRIILSDFKINIVKNNAYRDRFLVKNNKGVSLEIKMQKNLLMKKIY